MYSETCTPASLPVEDGQEFGTLATLATLCWFPKTRRRDWSRRPAWHCVALDGHGTVGGEKEISAHQRLSGTLAAPKSAWIRHRFSRRCGAPPVVRLESESDMV